MKVEELEKCRKYIENKQDEKQQLALKCIEEKHIKLQELE